MKTYFYTLDDIYKKLPVRKEDAHKGSCGKLLLIAGTKNMAGAAFFSAKAAYRSGVGLVYIYTPEENRCILQQLIPEAVLCTYPDGKPDVETIRELIEGKQAVAMGPGIGKSDEMKDIIRFLFTQEIPVVLDADGLNNLSEIIESLEQKKCNLVITPHMLEMSRLTKQDVKEVIVKKQEVAISFAQKYNVVTVLKDHHTIVTNGEEVYLNQTGNDGMATGGSGDVLTGVAGALLAQGMDSFEAAKAAVYLHGKAGDDAAAVYGRRAVMAGDIAEYVFRGL